MLISENMEFAEFALENWHTKDKFLVLEKQAGKKSEGGNYSWQ
jgi:hypothetical protein